MTRLQNHELIVKCNELSGTGEHELADACGYKSKSTGRVNLDQFRKELEKAKKPFSITSAVTLYLSDCVGDALGDSGYVLDCYPNLEHLYSECVCDSDIKITAFVGPHVQTPERIMFIVASKLGTQPVLITDDSMLDEITRMIIFSGFSTASSSHRALAYLAQKWNISTPELQVLAGTSLAITILASALYSSHLVSNSETRLPAFERFLPKKVGRVIACWRPCYDDVWVRHGSACQLEEYLYKELAKPGKVVSATLFQTFAHDGEGVRVLGWEDVLSRLDQFSNADSGWITGLDADDALNWHCLVRLTESLDSASRK
jgi:hypothetical protein